MTIHADTAPNEPFASEVHEPPVVDADESSPLCPECGSAAQVSKWGTYRREPHGMPAVRVQRYWCEHCDSSFSASLDGVADGCRYPTAVRRLVRIVYLISGTSCLALQLICSLYFGVTPSLQRLHDWRTVSTEELVTNELPTHLYSGFYAYDEQYLWKAGERVYRLLVYDTQRRVPVAEQLVDRVTDDAIRSFVTSALADKSCDAVTTDGRQGLAKIVENDLGAAHHRCVFHLLKNFEDDLETMLGRSWYTPREKAAAAILGSEFEQLFKASSYSAAVQRLEAVLDEVEHLPSQLRKHVEKVDANRETFLGYLYDERVARTSNSCEQYYSHTQSTTLKRRFSSQAGLQSFWKQQQLLRTIREGFVPPEVAIAPLRDRFPAVDAETIENLYTGSKRRFLRARDDDTG